ncbi:hypothetical protein U9M48_014059 [Paspalum notatum var. saurae]|uniref:DUF3444 domain-containing protein n=1 Tax=Paspalum notatum var. saurae TaxID=547442 RepID=A0AAQ3T170_PASNO
MLKCDSCDDKMSSENVNSDSVASSILWFAEHLPSEIDSQGDGNKTHDGTANSGDTERFDDIVSGFDNQSAEHLSRKVDSQRDEATDIVGEKSCYSECLFLPTPDSYLSPGRKSVDLKTDSVTGRMNPGTEHIATVKIHREAHLSMENLDISSEQDKSLQKNVHGTNEYGGSSHRYPDSSFHNFEELRSHEKFECGQYSDADKFPKFYGSMAGRNSGWSRIYPSAVVWDWRAMYEQILLSHVMHARQTSKKWQFEILPQVGEIWAIYMNWSPRWAPSGKDPDAVYAVGKIRRRSKLSTTVELLTKVDGYVSVFRPGSQKGALKIPVKENLRFSH